MQAITFNYPGSKIGLNEESLCLRYCFLVSELAVSAGKSYETIGFELYYTPKNIVEKVEMISEYYKSKNDKDFDIKADEVKTMYQFLKKTRHHSKEGIVHMKKFERSLETLFADIKNELYEYWCNTGLPQLFPLAKEGMLRVCPLRHDDPEFEGDEFIPASKILQLQLPADEIEDPATFCFGYHFFLDSFFSELKIPMSYTDKKAASGGGFLHACIRIPNVNLLSAKELETVRTHIQEPADRFNRRMNEWILMTCKNLPADETHAYFEDYILPAAGVLDTLMKENEILKHCSRVQNDEVSSLIFIGELPYKIILDYYKFFNIINETTLNKVTESKEQNPLLNGRMPVMIMHASIEGSHATREAKESAELPRVLPSKKSISID